MLAALAACGGAGGSATGQDAATEPALSPAAQLGELIFKDANLSEPAGMSCETCHQPDKAHATNLVVQPGVVAGHVGLRNAPSLRYLRFSPVFSFGADGPVGGFFRDGRAPTITAQAPTAIAAAICVPVPMPPAATTGNPVFSFR